jgi:hypothetical protein
MAVQKTGTRIGVTNDQKSHTQPGEMPSDVSGRLTFFDRFATRVNRWVSRAWFFALCAADRRVGAQFRSIHTWQLLINTVTTIITFLLVALLRRESSSG